ncbi:hypothetical protein F4825DRAFT_423845 [Nemania diffusa]|nr:hypothetical protein F4825DRAFT_423845 [Nemania diffusa]
MYRGLVSSVHNSIYPIVRYSILAFYAVLYSHTMRIASLSQFRLAFLSLFINSTTWYIQGGNYIYRALGSKYYMNSQCEYTHTHMCV